MTTNKKMNKKYVIGYFPLPLHVPHVCSKLPHYRGKHEQLFNFLKLLIKVRTINMI